MSKTVKVLIALALALVLATPAMAAMKLNGYYRLQFISDNIGAVGAKDARTTSQVDQRLRMKLTNQLNDYVKFVYYAEIDTPWGQAGSTPSGSAEFGGTDGADGVNLETKNVYLEVAVPDTIFTVRAGVQGFALGKDYVVIGDDMPGLRVNAKVNDNVKLVAFYSKFFEDGKTQWDDEDFYSIEAMVKASDAAKFGVAFAWYDSNGLNNRGTAGGLFTSLPAGYDNADIYYIVLDGDLDLGVAKLAAQFAYDFGTVEGTGVTDIDLSGYMATAKVTGKAGGADLGLRLTFYSADDNATDNDVEIFAGDITGGAYEFYKENLHIFFTDKYYNNTAGGRLALTQAAYNGNGLFAINATANVKLPAGYDLKAGAGYFMAVEENGAADDDLGFEIAADFGRKLAEKVDVRLIGAYAVLGDFFNTTTNSNDPDDIFLTKAVINVSF
ncbi:hypothetical protein EDC39_10354 [Geothermobacter ehrlichii]|uniref:Alginate export domain-containing protein n=1 Tax=Geothermobacter ehrlichii TaxID=213224 RepID=A0A5D3WL98_9BACT|nr:hypothetical protein [Geothermobacter ehrlichii]TYO99211.1 hypothetical protein EDC39_10354 [Geothermobacter ehrlichii]